MFCLLLFFFSSCLVAVDVVVVAAVVAHIPAAFVAADCKHVGPNLECALEHPDSISNITASAIKDHLADLVHSKPPSKINTGPFLLN